jgi:hypothetical protein
MTDTVDKWEGNELFDGKNEESEIEISLGRLLFRENRGAASVIIYTKMSSSIQRE